jgi:putative methyltransferase (TIGR04325 family)
MYRDRIERVYTNDYPLLFWLSRVLPAAGRVFDFGGHIGLARCSFDRYLRFPEALVWEVCDVPAVVEEGRRFAASMQISSLRFTTERSGADGADVLFSSGALQYLEDGPAELLRPLKAPPKHVLLNLLPVHPSRRSMTLQSIGTAYCPYQIFEERSLVHSFEQLASVKGYTGFFFSKERGLTSAAVRRA